LNVSEQLTQLQHLSYLQRLSITITPSQPHGPRGRIRTREKMRPNHIIDKPLIFARETIEITIPLFASSLTSLKIDTVANPTPDPYTKEKEAIYTFILPLSLLHLTKLVIDHQSSNLCHITPTTGLLNQHLILIVNEDQLVAWCNTI
jgi:hypothetical protein